MSLLSVLSLLGAALADEPTPADTARFRALQAEIGDLSATEFVARLQTPAYRTGLGFDPAKAKYYDEVTETLKMTAEEKRLLHDNGFVLVDHEQRYSFGAMYFAIYAKDLPVFVTTDSILHAMHRSFDEILKNVEVSALAPTISAVLANAHAAMTPGEPLPDHTRDVDLYLTVARNLLAGAAAPATAEDRFSESWDGTLLVPSRFGQDEAALELLKFIQDGSLQTPDTPEVTTIFGRERMIDFSQFRPRGHYTESDGLKRYFRTMMWLGRVDCGFELEHPRQVRGAALLSSLLDESGGDVDLSEMDTLITWLIGESDSFNVAAMLDNMDTQQVQVSDLADPAALARLQEHLRAVPRIRSQVVVSDPSSPEIVAPPAVFQLFGQRFVVDSFVLSNVVFDSILYEGQKVERMMPSGLDVAAALGNPEAARLLEGELTAYPYGGNLWAATEWVRTLPESTWSESVYNTWLSSLRALDADVTAVENMPQAMQGLPWQRKQLQTQLASWAELRHDTVLYVQQSYTAYPSCEYPAGYVEPYPAVYAAVQRFTEATAAALGAPRFPSAPDSAAAMQSHIDFLGRMGEIVGTLQGLAEKELAGRPFSPGEAAFLKKVIDRRGGGSGPPRYDGWYPELFRTGGTGASEWSPEVADVHTDPASGQVLSVATGDADYLVIAIDNEGDTRIFVGPAYSYYEFPWPVNGRLTDAEWQGVLYSEQAPARPDWIQDVLGTPALRDINR